MNENEIRYVLRNEKNFLDVFSRDELPKPEKFPFCLVANTDLEKDEGEHWVAIMADKDGNGFYFDSYGDMPEKSGIEFKNYMKKYFKKRAFNENTLQCLSCVTCGQYVCCYIILRERIGVSHADFLKAFTENPEFNDEIVKYIFQLVT